MIQVVKRVFDILAIIRENGALPLKEVAELSSLQKTTCHNILKSLVETGVLECPRSGVYQIGNELRRLASTPISDKALIKIASGHVERLAENTGETVVLGVLRGNMVEVLCSSEGAHVVVVRTGAHKQGSVYHWATGRVLLGHESKQIRAKIRRELGPPTMQEWPEAARHPERIEADLDQIRNMEIVTRVAGKDGVLSLACPVRRGDDKVIAALGISLPGFRADDNIEGKGRELLLAAEAISHDLSEIF
jgi:DNA-binding IclR family transcriptional regulator